MALLILDKEDFIYWLIDFKEREEGSGEKGEIETS